MAEGQDVYGRLDALAKDVATIQTQTAIVQSTQQRQEALLERVGDVLERIARIDERTLIYMQDMQALRDAVQRQDDEISELQRIAARNTTGISGTERLVFGGVTGLISFLVALAVAFATP